MRTCVLIPRTPWCILKTVLSELTNKRMPWFGLVGGKRRAERRLFLRLLSKRTLALTKEGLLFLLCVSWDIAHLMKCYCHLTTIFFSFPIWVWYWNILLSRETALIKYYNMNNVCKCARHTFHKAKMNWFLVLPDVFAACRNSIWSEWQNNWSFLSSLSFDTRCHFIPRPRHQLCLAAWWDYVLWTKCSSCLINYFIF